MHSTLLQLGVHRQIHLYASTVVPAGRQRSENNSRSHFACILEIGSHVFVELPYRPTATGSRARRVFQQYRQVQQVWSREWPRDSQNGCVLLLPPFAAAVSS